MILPVLLLAIAAAVAACSSDDGAASCDEVDLENAWVRLPAGENTAFYFDASNGGDAEVAVVSATSDIATRYALHETEMVDGQMEMKAVPDQQVAVPAGETVSFEPGGLHVMIMGLTTDLQEGDSVDFTIGFDADCSIDVEAPVEAFTQ
jgi:copper(I)-binding protein